MTAPAAQPPIPPNVALPLIQHRVKSIRRLDMSFVDRAIVAVLEDLTDVVAQLSAALDEAVSDS